MKQKLIGIALGLAASSALGFARDGLKNKAVDKTTNRNAVPVLIFLLGGAFYLAGDILERKLETKFPTDKQLSN